MKNKLKLFGLLLLLSMALTNCTKNDQPYASSQQNSEVEKRAEIIPKILLSERWSISKFRDEKRDLTEAFKGYVLKFYPNGKLIAENGGNPINGTWEYAPTDNPNELVLRFFYYPLFEELSETWHITVYTDDYFRMVTEDDGNAKFLQITKVGRRTVP